MTRHLITADHASYVAVYRTGGKDLPVWRASVQYPTWESADSAACEIRCMGYRAMVWTVGDVLAVGLPVGWDYEA